MATRPSIIHLLSDLGYASVQDLQEIQARQVIYGGDQETNLLELELVTEDQLLSALAQQTGLPRAPSGRLSIHIEPTRQLAEQGRRIILGHTSASRAIAFVDEELKSEDYAALQLQFGEGLRYAITTRLRIDEALAHASGTDLAPRQTALLNRLGKRRAQAVTAPAPLQKPIEHAARVEPQTEKTQVALQPMAAKTSQLDEQEPSSRGETAPPPLGYEDITASAAQDVQRGKPLSSGQTDGHPYTRKNAEQDLLGAKNRDRIIDILLQYGASYFQYTAVFGILSKEARGLRSNGPGASSEALRSLNIPLDLPSVLRQVRDKGEAQISRLRASGLEGGITRDLKRSSGTDTFLLPISVAGRPVLLLWGDNGNQRLFLEQLTELIDFAQFVSKALEHVLIERKRASRVAEPAAGLQHLANISKETRLNESRVPEAPALNLSIPPDTSEPLPALRSASANTALSLGTASIGPVPHESVPPSSTPVSPRPLRRQTQRNSAAPAPGDPFGTQDPSSHTVAEVKKRALTTPGQDKQRADSDHPPSFPPEPPRTLRGFPEARTPSLTPKVSETATAPTKSTASPSDDAPPSVRAPLMSRRIVPVSAPPRAPSTLETREAPPPPLSAPTFAPSSTSPEPEQPSIATPSALKPAVIESFSPAPDPSPRAPLHRSSTLVSRAPLPEPDEDGWNSPAEAVVRRVDPVESQRTPAAHSYSDLVRELLEGNTSVIPRLVAGGETAVGALIAEFPGPVCAPARPTTKASECGPILEALAALGQKASPFLTVRTADEDPEVRRWATFLLGEMPGKESAKAIASRLLDDAVEVRRAALASARRCRSDVLTRRTLRAHVEQICRDPHLPIESRCSAVEALADVREHEAIPTLLVLLEGNDRALSRATRWALSVLTRQDFGSDVTAWRAFWQEHRDEDRVEWLIASLDHEQRDIRRAAGEELKAMTNGDIDFDEDQPSSARRLAQARFREWWHESGKASAR